MSRMSDGSGDRPSLLDRPRLLRRLDDAFPVTVLEGHVGSGKRTLVSQWAAAAPSGDVRIVTDLRGRRLDRLGVVHRVLAAADEQGVPIDPSVIDDRPAAALAPRAPAHLALVDVERTDAADLVGAIEDLREHGVVRAVTVATRDGSELVPALEKASIPHRFVGGSELRFDTEELTHLVSSRIGPVDPTAVDHLMRVTGGVVGMVARALQVHPQAVAAGTLTRREAVSGIWSERPADPTPYERFLLTLVAAPRLTLDQVRDLSGEPDARRLLNRLVAEGWGRMRHADGWAQAIFAWSPAIRERVLQLATGGRGESAWAEGHRRAAQVAAEHDDPELQVVSLVAAGDLVEADQVARRRLWELLVTDDPRWWRPLTAQPSSAVSGLASLQFLYVVHGAAQHRRMDPHDLAAMIDRFIARGDDPSGRLHRLATGLFVAATRAGIISAEQVVRRWERLDAETLTGLVRGSAEVSDLLLAAAALLRLDRVDLAGTLAEVALRVVESDRSPDARRRRAHAELLVEAVGRARADHAVLARGPAPELPVDPRRKADVVARGILRGWEAIDARDPAAAVRHSGAALNLVDPTQWPHLVLVHVLGLIGTGRVAELARMQTLFSSSVWQERHGGIDEAAHAASLVALLCSRVLGGPLASSRDPLTPAPRRWSDAEEIQPRLRQADLVQHAAAEAAEGRFEPALTALRQAQMAAPGSGLVPVLLRTFAEDEVASLRSILRGTTIDTTGELRVMLAEVEPLGTSRKAPEELSPRELEIVAKIRQGRTNRQIAEELFISVNTVKFHRANLYRKWGVDNRDRLVAEAIRRGL